MLPPVAAGSALTVSWALGVHGAQQLTAIFGGSYALALVLGAAPVAGVVRAGRGECALHAGASVCLSVAALSLLSGGLWRSFALHPLSSLASVCTALVVLAASSEMGGLWWLQPRHASSGSVGLFVSRRVVDAVAAVLLVVLLYAAMWPLPLLSVPVPMLLAVCAVWAVRTKSTLVRVVSCFVVVWCVFVCVCGRSSNKERDACGSSRCEASLYLNVNGGILIPHAVTLCVCVYVCVSVCRISFVVSVRRRCRSNGGSRAVHLVL